MKKLIDRYKKFELSPRATELWATILIWLDFIILYDGVYQQMVDMFPTPNFAQFMLRWIAMLSAYFFFYWLVRGFYKNYQLNKVIESMPSGAEIVIAKK